MTGMKSLKLVLGSVLFALAMLALTIAPGLLSDPSSTTPAHAPRQVQR